MKLFKLGVIRVLTQEQEKVNAHGRLIEKFFPYIDTVSRCIPDQYEGVHNDDTEAVAAAKVVKLGMEMAANVDAIVVSCCGDPGVKKLRQSVSVPVVGAGEAVALLANRYGKRAGVLGITDSLPIAYGHYLSDIAGSKYRPDNVHTTLDLLTPEGRAAVFDMAKDLKADGAEVIAIACTGIGALEGFCEEMEKACKIPVIDPIKAEAALATFEYVRNNSLR